MNKVIVILLITFFVSCKGVQNDTIVFQSNFEFGIPKEITGGETELYNGSMVLGRYSQGGFTLKLDSLKRHDLVRISFDLYIHDTWDGNATGANGRDIWIMNIDGWSTIYSTFANGECTDCSQSYPVLQPDFINGKLNFAENKPNSNAIKTDLPGACALKDVKGGTSMYRIARTFEHTGSTLEIGCFGQLEDPDLENKNCNESWSVDNMKITLVEFR
jgi:hypothetical protein